MAIYGYCRISQKKQNIERQVRNILNVYPTAIIAEKEVENLRQRTREGIVTARLNGKQIGARSGEKCTTKKSVKIKGIIEKHSSDFNGNLSYVEIMHMTGVAKNTYYKYKKELNESKSPLQKGGATVPHKILCKRTSNQTSACPPGIAGLSPSISRSPGSQSRYARSCVNDGLAFGNPVGRGGFFHTVSLSSKSIRS